MDNINEIISSLTADDIKSLKETAEAIFGKTESFVEHSENQFSNNSKSQKESFYGSNSFPNPEMFSKIASVMSMLQASNQDRRCDLIRALKPNLSKSRQAKADDAIKILKLLDLLPMLSELSGRGE